MNNNFHQHVYSVHTVIWYLSTLDTTYLNFVTRKDCNTFVYENGYCYLGNTTLSSGNVITESDFATATTLYATDKALTDYLYPWKVTTYCCVTALKVQENLGNFQLDVTSGTYKHLYIYYRLQMLH
jgi:hypothetical protein